MVSFKSCANIFEYFYTVLVVPEWEVTNCHLPWSKAAIKWKNENNTLLINYKANNWFIDAPCI